MIKAPIMPADNIKIIGFILDFAEKKSARAKITKAGRLIKLKGFVNKVSSAVLLIKTDDAKRIKAAAKIIPIVVGRITFNTDSTIGFVLNLLKTEDTIITIIIDGKAKPIMAEIEPPIPAVLNPTNVAVLKAIGPGVICERATISEKSFTLIMLNV
jgi:hypothetical protein